MQKLRRRSKGGGGWGIGSADRVVKLRYDLIEIATLETYCKSFKYETSKRFMSFDMMSYTILYDMIM